MGPWTNVGKTWQIPCIPFADSSLSFFSLIGCFKRLHSNCSVAARFPGDGGPHNWQYEFLSSRIFSRQCLASIRRTCGTTTRSPARALPLWILPRQRRTAHLKPLTSMASSQSALDFRSHASRRSAMCEAMLCIVVQVFHIGEPNFSARPCSTNGLDHLIASLSGQLLQH